MALHINSASDYKQFGVNVLTGEACGYGLRLLCDLTKEGQELVAAYLGGVPTEGWPSNWNSGAVASCMLPRDLLFGTFAVFTLFRAGCVLVVEPAGGGFTGVAHDDPLLPQYEMLIREGKTLHEVYHVYRRKPTDAERNTHQFTGRTV